MAMRFPSPLTKMFLKNWNWKWIQEVDADVTVTATLLQRPATDSAGRGPGRMRWCVSETCAVTRAVTEADWPMVLVAAAH